MNKNEVVEQNQVAQYEHIHIKLMLQRKNFKRKDL